MGYVEIMNYLKKNPGFHTAQEISKATNTGVNSIRQCLRRMLTRGVVERQAKNCRYYNKQRNWVKGNRIYLWKPKNA